MWERSHWIVESSVLMRMHPDFDFTRSTIDVGLLFALWSEHPLLASVVEISSGWL